jgi:uncharacterized protein (TIGR02145 family)
MKKIVPLLLLACLLVGISVINSCKKDVVIPTLTTTAVTNITINSSTTGGSITKDGGAGISARGVCWGTTSNPDLTGSFTTDGNGAGSFESNLTGLTPNTLYHIRAYATNKAGTAYGADVIFTTTAIVIGTLTTSDITLITLNSAVSGGNITSDGNDPITARGTCWATVTGPTITNDKTSDGTGTGSFVSNLAGLLSGTTYYVRAYATNSVGTAYGNEVLFSTILGAPTNVSATPGNASATITFTAPGGGSTITGYAVTSIPGGFTGTGSASPITVTGLTNGTAYTFTVIATNANGSSSPSSASNSVIPSAGPGVPTIGTATKGNAQATVTFTAPVSNGGSVITGYTVTSSPGGITHIGTTSPIIVTGLTNGTAYTFTVFATNANGNSSPSSASNSVTPSAVPGAPTIGTATKGNAQATVPFTAPVSNGGSVIILYTVTSTPGNFTGTGTASPITVSGLTNGTAYTFTVIATNANGPSLPSSASNSVTPSTLPGAPTIGTATKGNAQASVAFIPGSTGGSPIIVYTVTSTPGNFIGTGTASPITVSGLTNGSAYTFTVIATNANGNSAASAASNSVTPSAVPGAPTIGTATAGTAKATITFTAPVSDGGSAITGYTVTSIPGTFTGTGSASPITVTGLTNGTAYTFTVTATNANGPSLPSSASNSVIPTPPITDIDGNSYNTVTIGTQVWMAENLKTTKFNDGTVIPTTIPTALDISNTITYPTPVFQWPVNGSESNVAEYGRLYTFWVGVASNPLKVCPTGWHVPSDTELEALKTTLGGETVAGGKLKEAGLSHWQTPNLGADNSTGFTARGGGYRVPDGSFASLNISSYLWSNTVDDATLGWGQGMSTNNAILLRGGYTNNDGVPIRCLKD